MGAMNATDIHQEKIMSTYHVYANAADFGLIEAPDAQEARDIGARVAGYGSEAQMSEDLGGPSEIFAQLVTEEGIPAGAVAYKYADPTEGARWILSQEEADEIAAEDPSLIVAV